MHCRSVYSKNSILSDRLSVCLLFALQQRRWFTGSNGMKRGGKGKKTTKQILMESQKGYFLVKKRVLVLCNCCVTKNFRVDPIWAALCAYITQHAVCASQSALADSSQKSTFPFLGTVKKKNSRDVLSFWWADGRFWHNNVNSEWFLPRWQIYNGGSRFDLWEN